MHRFRFRTAIPAAVPALFALAAMAAEPIGQTASQPQGDEIVVEAPRTLRPPRRTNRFRGETELVAKVRLGVFYHDLRLADPKDASRLTERLESTARQACAYLDDLYPLQKDPDCRKRAVDAAMPEARAAIAKAQEAAAPVAPAAAAP